MSTLSMSGVAASFGARPLFAGLDLIVASGDVTALVGPNGSGKTTLMRIIAGLHPPDAGSVRLSPPDAAVGYLPQALPEVSETILDYARRRTGVGDATAEFESASQALAAREPDADDRYSRALDRWLHLGGADLDVRLAEVLAKVGLPVDLDRPLGSLSGGQAARASLASILVSQYDVLLLDEPTNNLDADGLAAMTAFVRTTQAPVLIASHDRAFLDDVATSVVELDLAQQQIAHYAGGWSDYRDAKALARSQATEAYERYDAERTDLIEQARRKTEWAAHGRAKAARLGPHMQLEKKFREDKARKMDQRAARVRKSVDRLDEVDQPRKEWELRYQINEAAPPAEVVVTLENVVVRRGDFTVGPVSVQVARGDRIALSGPNGSGKSTLLDALLGRLEPSSGRLSWGTRVSVGVLDQERSEVAGEGALIDVVHAALGGTDEAETRTLLAKFGLGAEHIGRPCSSLSLGERTRASLAVLQGRAVNVVILDEPTNHLDVEAIEQLQSALEGFGGTLVIVTHDRRLIGALGITSVWHLTTGPPVRVRVQAP
ncbi:MAG TPA: ABC-F family ATP-binding cassette domain-containing protein [Propionibacteriaceae bacterium]|nr:ABC-F family ATP-binding cassette domain-containing protein [Propionibacteriaceae bacterium]